MNDYDSIIVHPLWLGLIFLFGVLTILLLLCFLRKKYGSIIRTFYENVSFKKKSM